MDKLIEGYRSFLSVVFPGRQGQFHLLADQQAPETLFITCSDSRIVPDLILQTQPGDIFITRNAGNVVPVGGNDVDGCTATIEYAVEVLKIKHAILCGHSDCGAMKAALSPKDIESLPKARRWLSHVEGAFSHRQPVESGRRREWRTGFADSRQCGGATAQSPRSALGGACGDGGPAGGAWLVLRHS